MKLLLGSRTFESGDFAIMADRVVDGADIVEVAADPVAIAEVRAEHPELVIATAPGTADEARRCVSAGADMLIGDEHAPVAAATGAALMCTEPARAEGVRPDGILVGCEPTGSTDDDVQRVRRLVQEDRAVLVTARGATTCSRVSLSMVYARIGVQVFRTAEVAITRKVLAMIAQGAI